jgi:6-phosphogluconolactonase/glucosamine-6-phosphate isomerase/deaminase
MTFLKSIDHVVMYVVGGSKKTALDAALLEKGKLNIYPARIIHEMRDVWLYTDQT